MSTSDSEKDRDRKERNERGRHEHSHSYDSRRREEYDRRYRDFNYPSNRDSKDTERKRESGERYRRERSSKELENFPELYSIHRGKVESIKQFGAFISLEGYKKQGLLHVSEISNYRTENVSDVLEVSEQIYVKVISVKDGKISLSMKNLSQRTGEDQDPNNVQAEMKQNQRKEYTYKPQSPLRLEYSLPTVCSRCKSKGHLASECFSSQGYNLIEEEELPKHEHQTLNISEEKGEKKEKRKRTDKDTRKKEKKHKKKEKKKEKKKDKKKKENKSRTSSSSSSNSEEN